MSKELKVIMYNRKNEQDGQKQVVMANESSARDRDDINKERTAITKT